MAEFKDVEEALIESTKNGKLDWAVGTDSGGYWHTNCDGVRFQVRRSGWVEVFGDAPSMRLGNSPDLLEVLEKHKPLALEVTLDEALRRALKCLQDHVDK